MATTATKAEVPTFSYAQAAKGLAVSTTTQALVKNTEQSAKITHEAEANKASTPDQSADPSRDTDKTESITDPESKSTTTGSSKNAISGASSPNFGTASTSTLAKEDEIPAIANGVSDPHWDKQSQASTLADKSSNGKENKKDDSAKSGDKEKEKNPPKELKVAPPPAVNVWQQRKEAQEAKVKASAAVLKPVNTTTSKATPPKQASSQTTDLPDSAKATNKKKTTNEGQGDSSASLGKDRKRTENSRARDEGAKKSNNRLPRPNEESAEVAPPPVADATAWPTPQTALGEEKRKGHEKGDKPEKIEKSPLIRGKEKWTPVHYVPTAVFNTPLPSGARRGGRPSRGGRDGGRGGAHASNNNTNATTPAVDNKSPSTSQLNQVPPKPHGNLPERGRNEGGLARANSLPAQARKPATTDANTQPEQRRFPQAQRTDTRPKATEENHAVQNGTTDATNTKTHREPRSVKVPEFTPAHKTTDHSPRSGTSPADAQPNGRFASGHDRRFDGPPRPVEASRETNSFVPREREYREFNRERGDYQRDRDHPKDRSESRPERGRGGYRGRGGHSYGAGPHNQHFQNSQMSQHPFVPKSFVAGDRQRSQQQTFQNGTQPQHVNHRLSLRSPSMPNSAAMYSAYPVPEINTVFQNYQPVPPGPMSAIPYQYMDPSNLIGLIQLQL
jgi:la-related protein 1